MVKSLDFKAFLFVSSCDDLYQLMLKTSAWLIDTSCTYLITQLAFADASPFRLLSASRQCSFGRKLCDAAEYLFGGCSEKGLAVLRNLLSRRVSATLIWQMFKTTCAETLPFLPAERQPHDRTIYTQDEVEVMVYTSIPLCLS